MGLNSCCTCNMIRRVASRIGYVAHSCLVSDNHCLLDGLPRHPLSQILTREHVISWLFHVISKFGRSGICVSYVLRSFYGSNMWKNQPRWGDVICLPLTDEHPEALLSGRPNYGKQPSPHRKYVLNIGDVNKVWMLMNTGSNMLIQSDYGCYAVIMQLLLDLRSILARRETHHFWDQFARLPWKRANVSVSPASATLGNPWIGGPFRHYGNTISSKQNAYWTHISTCPLRVSCLQSFRNQLDDVRWTSMPHAHLAPGMFGGSEARLRAGNLSDVWVMQNSWDRKTKSNKNLIL